MNWHDAEDFCRNKSGHLASVTSKAANDYVEEGKKQRGMNRLWIGGSDLEAEGTWRWVDCSPWDFTLWKPDEPNGNWGAQNCLSYFKNEHRWHDQSCKILAPFVCSQTICSDKNTWPPQTNAAIGGSILVFLLVLLLVVLFVLKRRRARSKLDVAHTDENPVYGTYFDPDPRAEVEDNFIFYKYFI